MITCPKWRGSFCFSRRRDRSRDRDKRRSRSSSSSDDDRGRKRKRSRSPKKHKKKRRWLIWPSKKVTTLPTDTSSILQYGVLPSDIYTIFDVASISITKYPLLGLLMALCPKNMQSAIYSCKKNSLWSIFLWFKQQINVWIIATNVI